MLVLVVIPMILIGIIGFIIPPIFASEDIVDVSNFRITDFSGNELDRIIFGQKILVEVELINKLDVTQEFVYNLTYENEFGVKNIHPFWIQGNLPASYTFPASLAPEFPSSGEYTITIEIWNNNNEKILIAPIISKSVVIESDPNSPVVSELITTSNDTPIEKITKPASNILIIYDQTFRFPENSFSPSYISLYNDRVYVIDNQENSIKVYDFDGNFIFDFLLSTPENTDPTPNSFTIDDGRLYITDVHSPSITVFSDDGLYLSSFQRDNHVPDDHELIEGYHGNMGISANNDKIYVADANHNNIHVFSLDGDYITSLTEDSTLSDVGASSFLSLDDEGNVKIGSDTEKIISPVSISIMNDKIYVVSTLNPQIQVFSEDGEFLSSFTNELGEELPVLPNVITSDNNDRIYVLYSQNQKIQVFSENGEFLFNFGNAGSNDGEFGYPVGIKVSNDGEIFVSDLLLKQIFVYDSNGNYVRSFEKLISNEMFSDPLNVVVDDDGRIYVTDFIDNLIRVFSSDQEFLFTIGEGILEEPAPGINIRHINAIAINDDVVYVAEYNNDIVHAFSKTGTHLFSFGETGTRESQFKGPSDISLGPDGKIYVADKSNHRIQVFSDTGEYISTIGYRGFDDNGFHILNVLEVDKDGRLYVADNSNDKVRVFTNDGDQIFEFGKFGINDDEFLDREVTIIQTKDGKTTFGVMPDRRATQTSYTNIQTPLIFSGEKGDTHLDIDPTKIVVDEDNVTFTITDRHGDTTIFVNDGNSSISFGTPPPVEDPAFDNIRDIKVDDKGRIYVVDSVNHNIRVFSSDGLPIFVLGKEGSSNDDFFYPADISIHDDSLYVADRSNQRIQIFSISETLNSENTLPKSENTSELVPSWIKNNAKWWSDGNLDDRDFTSGIEYLIKEEIIDVSVTVEPKPMLDFVDTSKDPQYYIDRYDNEESYKEWFDSNYPDYTIEEGTGFLNNEIPSWIKYNAKWWSDGLLSESDFLKGIEYLVEKEIIKVS